MTVFDEYGGEPRPPKKTTREPPTADEIAAAVRGVLSDFVVLDDDDKAPAKPAKPADDAKPTDAAKKAAEGAA